MLDKKHIPILYNQLNKLGYLNINEHFVWMSEMEWMPYEEVINYEYEEGITQEVLSFCLILLNLHYLHRFDLTRMVK